MFELKEIFKSSLYTVLSSVKLPLYWIVIIIIFFQYYKQNKIEKTILKQSKQPLFLKVVSSAAFGLFGGIIGSVIIILLRITLNPKDFEMIFLLALVLALFHPRFLCFSYGGGIISLISLIFGYPHINVENVLSIVAVLHMAESVLVILDGQSSKIPIFMERNDQIVGGFSMSRFWPVPFSVFVNGYGNFPLITIAALGYGDYALTKYPSQKVKETAGRLFLFSFILLFLSQISKNSLLFKYIGSVFSFSAHEFIIQWGRREESRGIPIFKPSEFGIKILYALPKGIGKKMKLKTGDVIISINGHKILSRDDLTRVMSLCPNYIRMEVFDRKRGVVVKEYKDYKNRIKNLGIFIIPKDPEYAFVMEEGEPRIKKIIKKLILKEKERDRKSVV